MDEIGTAAGIPISAPSESPISFFNSPYVGHRLATAVDIYTKNREWGDDVLSPVSGVVTRVRRIKMGQTKDFPSEEYDYAIGIMPDESSDLVVRILHCRPRIRIKEQVETGDPIGSSIRSRFFCYWTSPHYHVEVMDLTSFNRASQSRVLEVPPETAKIEEGSNHAPAEDSTFTITRIERDFVVGALDSSPLVSLGEFVGHPAVDAAGNLLGLLDTGFPHYPVCGVRRAEPEVRIRSTCFQWIPLGESITRHGGLSVHRQLTGFSVFMDDIRVRGVSTYLYRMGDLVRRKLPLKVIPLVPGDLLDRTSEGDVVKLSWKRYP